MGIGIEMKESEKLDILIVKPLSFDSTTEGVIVGVPSSKTTITPYVVVAPMQPSFVQPI